MNTQYLYREVYKLHLYIDKMIHKYPKKYYYTLGVKTRECNIEILLKLQKSMLANQYRIDTEDTTNILMKIEELKLYLKLANEYKIIPLAQISYLFFNIEGIKNLLS